MDKAYKPECYGVFANVYDIFMDNIPYEAWNEYLVSLLKEHGVDHGLILDLGCGTGNMTRLLAKSGYDMIAVDNSEEMLTIARNKALDKELHILYLCQDMRSFELYGTVRAVVSICDSMNYIIEPQDLCQVFRLVNNYLDPGGVFIFDLNTIYKYKELLGDATIAENREDCSFIWDNYYYEEEQINEYELSIFVRDNERSLDHNCGGEPFWRFTESHYQRAYKISEIQNLIEAAGMAFITAYDAFTKEPVNELSERIYIIAREKGKQK